MSLTVRRRTRIASRSRGIMLETIKQHRRERECRGQRSTPAGGTRRPSTPLFSTSPMRATLSGAFAVQCDVSSPRCAFASNKSQVPEADAVTAFQLWTFPLCGQRSSHSFRTGSVVGRNSRPFASRCAPTPQRQVRQRPRQPTARTTPSRFSRNSEGPSALGPSTSAASNRPSPGSRRQPRSPSSPRSTRSATSSPRAWPSRRRSITA
jgi:hypothetical protein